MPSARLQQSGSQSSRARVSVPLDLSAICHTRELPPNDSPARRLFIDFVEQYLQIEFQGLQAGYGYSPDLILFAGPQGSTLAVPTSILLESSREDALEIVRQKRIAAEHKFQTKAAHG